MANTEERITRTLVTEIAMRLGDERVTLYEATRILGYTLVALAETLPGVLPREADGAEAK